MNTVIVENCKTLFIGRRGENEVTEVVFDFTEWQEQFGTGVIDLYVKRSVDFDAYPVVLSIDGTVATWLVTAADTAVVGSGKIEFVYTVDQKVAKSAIFPFYVGEDIGQASSEPPDPYESWIETLTELGTETQANAQAAAQSASDAADSATSASESAGQAEDSAEDAEAWAVGERSGEPVSAGDETYENNAKYWAENARANAPVQSVNGKDGNVELTLDDIPNGETYARATPAQLAQISKNADDIADIDAMIPSITSESNHLVNVSFLTNRLTSYRTSAAQDTIDAGKQEKITAYGILKRDRSGNITAAVAGVDYVTADALNSYRKATAQDAIDNAQNENINKNTAAINTMQPAATAADIGKALIVETVANGKPTSYEYGEAGGGGGSALTAGDGLEISNDVISNTQGIEYIVGTQAAATSKWTGVSTDENLKVGKIIAYYLPYAGTSTAATLALTMADGTTTREISLQYKPNSAVTTQFPAGSIIILVYDGTYWRVNASYDTDTNTYPTGYCVTNGAVAAKTAACSFGYRGDTNYFPCLFRFANTAADATLAITTYAPEAAPIYVNGARTSATNTFGAGVILFLYYNGAYYCYNDGRFPILVDGAVTSVQEYAAGLLADYRTAADQDVIDDAQDERIEDLEQTTTATTIGPVAIASFDASVAGMPLKGLTVNIEPVQSGSGDPSPEENVRPISGWTGAKVARTGKNLLLDSDFNAGTQDGITYAKNDDGSYSASGTVSGQRTAFNLLNATNCKIYRPGAYAVSCDGVSSTGVRLVVSYKATESGSTQYVDVTNPSVEKTFNISATGRITGIYFRGQTTGTIVDTVLKPLLLLQEDDGAEWERGLGSIYDIAFPTEAGTVYGGTLDMVNKKLTVTYWGHVFNGEETVSGLQSSSPPNFFIRYGAPAILSNEGRICSHFQNVSITTANTVQGYTAVNATNRVQFRYTSLFTTVEEFKSWCAAQYQNGTPLVAVAMLAEPIEYIITDDFDIETLLGENNIWADTGDVTVTYGAYLETVKSYADQVGDSILSAIAPLETSYTASRAYTVGSYLFVGTKFYKVTAAIAEGGIITPDTNVIQTTVAEQLIAIAMQAFAIVTQPPNEIEASIGDSLTLSVTAIGFNLSYQWQYKRETDTEWTSATSDGAKQANWTITYTENLSTQNRKYRCMVTDQYGQSLISNAVSLITKT